MTFVLKMAQAQARIWPGLAYVFQDISQDFSPDSGWQKLSLFLSRFRRRQAETLEGYLAHEKHPPPRTLQWDYT